MKKTRSLVFLTPLMFSGAIHSVTAAADWWQPNPGLSWQVQYTGTLNTAVDAQVFNIDLFDTSASTIASLHGQGKKVICYFSAGSYENWRPDAGSFPSHVLGNNLDGWPGERWLDVRRSEVLQIMKDRMALAVSKGCDAVDPDNVDGYTNNNGLGLTYNDQISYNMALADSAHSLGLAIGLKNDLDQIDELISHVDFAVNEQCAEYNECNLLTPFIQANKPVFGIEYTQNPSQVCPAANQMNFDVILKRLDLNEWRVACREGSAPQPTASPTPVTNTAPQATPTPAPATTTPASQTTTPPSASPAPVSTAPDLTQPEVGKKKKGRKVHKAGKRKNRAARLAALKARANRS